MNRTPLQICALLLALAGTIITLVSTGSSKWKVSSTAGSVITSTSIFEGLWRSCAATSVGSVQCKRFTSVFSLATYIQVCRALMIIALILGLLSVGLSLFGLKCIKVGSNDGSTKGKIALTGGLMFILAGLCCLVAVSWYAAMITAQFFDPLYGGTKYEIGEALYLGWAGALLTMIGGSLLCCSYKKKKRTTKGAHKYNYSAPQSDFSQFKERKGTESLVATQAYV
ncbi:hypothetical protein FKM82_003996 [Ascaphus truei]|uniref:claudin-19-like isoform X1 n=1 Tax=Ascaphus truei TaxID=8439 RepID=UPI003F599C78